MVVIKNLIEQKAENGIIIKFSLLRKKVIDKMESLDIKNC
jgi:hypothetical protein